MVSKKTSKTSKTPKIKKPEKIKKTTIYKCDLCDLTTINKKDFNSHLNTVKHARKQKDNLQPTIAPEVDIAPEVEKVNVVEACECGKTYTFQSGLSRHKKTCSLVKDSITKTNKNSTTTKAEDYKSLKTIILELVKSNAIMQQQLAEALTHAHNSVVNNNTMNTINSNNKTFNLMFFLNEQCKDAMNMSEFVDSFDLQLSDLESVGELGYVEGMTKIFIDKLNSMDIYKRPMHCSDGKREIIYIKDENRWEREQPNNPKLRKAIKNVSFKNMKLAAAWSEAHPDSRASESRLNDVYMKIVLESTGGSGEISDSQNKIMKRIAKEIIIPK